MYRVNDNGKKDTMKVYIYHYTNYTNQHSVHEVFYTAQNALKEVACFLKLRIGDAEYFGTATRCEQYMHELLQQEKVTEAYEIFNGMQSAERIEVLECEIRLSH
jgi:hypothetical protein